MNKIQTASKHQRNSSCEGFVYDKVGSWMREPEIVFYKISKRLLRRVNCWENSTLNSVFHETLKLLIFHMCSVQSKAHTLTFKNFTPHYSSSSCIFLTQTLNVVVRSLSQLSTLTSFHPNLFLACTINSYTELCSKCLMIYDMTKWRASKREMDGGRITSTHLLGF